MPEKTVIAVFTPNPFFSGVRNAGRFSASFENGKAEVDEETARLFVANYHYLCPTLFPEHEKQVAELHDKPASIELSEPQELPEQTEIQNEIKEYDMSEISDMPEPSEPLPEPVMENESKKGKKGKK